MKHDPQNAGLALSALALILMTSAVGCGGSAVSASTSEATVHGTVTIQGKKATLGKVYFNASNIRRKEAAAAEATIGKDGTYSVRTLVGRNTISLSHPDLARDPVLQYFTSNIDVKGADVEHDIVIPR